MLTVKIVSHHCGMTRIYEATNLEHDPKQGYVHLGGCSVADIVYDPQEPISDHWWYDIRVSNREGKQIAEFRIPIPQGEEEDGAREVD